MTKTRLIGRMCLGLGLLAAFATASSAASAAGNETKTSHGKESAMALAPAELVAALHQVNQFEIDAGKVAQDRATATSVKEYGEKLERDHKAADDKLTEYASNKKISLDSVPASVSQKMQDMRTKLDGLRKESGAVFDRQFTQTMKMGHDDAIKMIDDSRAGVGDPRLKTLLGSLEPTLHAHRQIAENILKGLNVAGGETPQHPSSVQGRPSRRTGH